jgi:2-methylisocitrate lyase-like PEP mutase family enzyme
MAPRPVNVLAFDYGWTTRHLADLGVRRISLGGDLARKAYAEAMNAAKAWLDTGALSSIAAQAPIPFPKVFG